MNKSTVHGFSRRDFLVGTSMLGAATLVGPPRIAAAEPPPETSRIRLVKNPAICLAPEYIAEELLRLEGFSQIEYVETDVLYTIDMLHDDRADVTVASAPDFLPWVEAGRSVVEIA